MEKYIRAIVISLLAFSPLGAFANVVYITSLPNVQHGFQFNYVKCHYNNDINGYCNPSSTLYTALPGLLPAFGSTSVNNHISSSDKDYATIDLGDEKNVYIKIVDVTVMENNVWVKRSVDNCTVGTNNNAAVLQVIEDKIFCIKSN